jgi:uncharacterized membrane protein YgdD (TMEM256/DUF423 family)
MTALQRFPLLAAGFLGLTGVLLGALGAHALEPFLMEHGMAHAWETAARYHLVHAIALLALGAWASRLRPGTSVAGRSRWAARCWTLGTILFSGSLYGLAVGGPRWLGPVTPIGGLALMAGWAFLIAAALARDGE